MCPILIRRFPPSRVQFIGHSQAGLFCVTPVSPHQMLFHSKVVLFGKQGCLRLRTQGLKNGRLPTVLMDTWLKHGLLGAVGGVDVLPGTVPSGSSGPLTSGVLADLT
ncbi:hypothetical protein JOQ06_002801 [Pogonophryne albipinna]|uniref:Uncharacterized protein n=1 Tax=Pogonophryne albipinna TaxID=1090488 RepID=A0AAD6FLZ9_9TELE|nr:hypothetical protein JOQ06_002801 [Pogonophryne albipinna]